jgi:hypothetical protein
MFKVTQISLLLELDEDEIPYFIPGSGIRHKLALFVLGGELIASTEVEM